MRVPAVKISIISVLAALLGAGCVSFKRSEPSRFYVLSPLATPDPARAASELVLGVRSVRVPDYLMRPEIVTRADDYRVHMAQYDRWAQPIDEDIAGVLRDNLSTLSSSARVLLYPWHKSTPIDVSIEVDVIRFDRGPSGDVTLEARWRLFEGDSASLLAAQTSKVLTPCESSDYDSIVAAMSEALAELSRRIAGSIPASS